MANEANTRTSRTGKMLTLSLKTLYVTFSGETTHTPQTGKTELLLQAYRSVHLLPVDVLP